MTENKGPLIVAICTFTLVLGGIFIFARVLVRTVLKPPFGADDVLIVITWFIILGFNTSYFVAISHGFGRHVAELSTEQVVLAARASVIGQILAVFAYPPGKAAVACLLLRLFPGKKLKWFLWSIVAANAVLFFLNGIFFLVECTPTAYAWDKSIKGGSCWDSKVLGIYGYVPGAIGAATDFVFAVVPWFYVVKLQLPIRQKILVGVGLSMGLLPFVCSILKIHTTPTISEKFDPTFDTVPLILTSTAELCAINVAACIPTLRPLYLWLTGKRLQGRNAQYYANTPEYRSQNHLSRRLGAISWKSKTQTQLDSSDNHEHYIMQHKTYDVIVETRSGSEAESAVVQESRTVVNAGSF